MKENRKGTSWERAKTREKVIKNGGPIQFEEFWPRAAKRLLLLVLARPLIGVEESIQPLLLLSRFLFVEARRVSFMWPYLLVLPSKTAAQADANIISLLPKN